MGRAVRAFVGRVVRGGGGDSTWRVQAPEHHALSMGGGLPCGSAGLPSGSAVLHASSHSHSTAYPAQRLQLAILSLPLSPSRPPPPPQTHVRTCIAQPSMQPAQPFSRAQPTTCISRHPHPLPSVGRDPQIQRRRNCRQPDRHAGMHCQGAARLCSDRDCDDGR